MMHKNSARLCACTLLVLAACAHAAEFTVTNTSNGGPGSLRQAIFDANSSPGADRIVFNIPGSGRQKIDVSQNFLPAVTDTLTIDGYTQPGSQPNTDASFSNAIVLIQIDGGGQAPQNSAPTGLTLSAPGCVVRGVMITAFNFYSPDPGGFQRFGGYGIDVQRENCVVEGNFIGTDGSDAPQGNGNRGAGIRVRASQTLIGGNNPAARNVIGGSRTFLSGTSAGVLVDNGGVTPDLEGVVIIGNQIGRIAATAGVATAEGNDIGIALGGARFTNTVIGGTNPASANLISGNQIGIRLGYDDSSPRRQAAASGVLIQGNLIGVDPNSFQARNQNVGIQVLGSGNTIGGLEPGAGNEITRNGTGVEIAEESVPATGNRILSNRIYLNERAVFLARAPGSTLNDYGDADTGPNNLQNFPIITRFTSNPDAAPEQNNATLEGALNSTPSTEFTLQFFLYNPEPRLLGTATIRTNASGDARFSFAFRQPPDEPLQSGSYFAATATDSKGNTSEFTPQNGPVQLANISTRGFVGAGDRRLIGGFITRSNTPKKVIVRALGPSVDVAGRLADPYLELYDSSGTLIAQNDDWRSAQQQEVLASGVAPSNDKEPAIVASLAAGQSNYTAQVSGANGTSGVGVVEVYDLDAFASNSGRLVNISTRGFVADGENLLIGGFIVRGEIAERLIVRAIGPGLAPRNVADPLPDPTLELRDSSGELVAANDDWRSNEQEIPSALQPQAERDAALATAVGPGAYTAIVRGKGSATGVALVEVYDLVN